MWRLSPKLVRENDCLDKVDFKALRIEQKSVYARFSSSVSGMPVTPQTQIYQTGSRRTLPVNRPSNILNSYTHHGVDLRPQAAVELRNGEFMRIIEIVQDTMSNIILRGWIFQRTKSLNCIVQKRLNELCWILHVQNDDRREPEIQSIRSINVSEVLKRRRIRMTNRPYPCLSFREDSVKDFEQTVLNERVLVCRVKYICYYLDARSKENNQWCERALLQLKATECDSGYGNRMAEHNLRHQWRNKTIQGGMRWGWLSGEREFLWQEKLCDNNRSIRHPLRTPKYDFSIEDPMKRKSVGTIITQDDLPDPQYETASELNLMRDALEEIPFGRGRLRRFKDCPHTLEVEAQVKNYSRSGVLKSQYAEDFAQTFSLAKKRNAQEVDASAASHLTKRSKDLTRSASPSGSETTVGRGVSPQPFEEMCNPSKIRKMSIRGWGPPTSVPHPKTRGKASNIIDLTRPKSPSTSPIFNGRVSLGRADPLIGGFGLRPKAGESAAKVIDLTKPRHETCLPISIARARSALFSQRQISNASGRLHEATKANPCSLSRDAKSNSAFRGPRIRRLHMAEGARPKHFATSKSTAQRYTFGDCFCGAGGMCRGAVMAGFRAQWGIDSNLPACQSYARNFFGTTVYNFWAHDFVQLDRCVKVDVLHLSPPCQFFSPAHTHMGKDDEMNTASLFAVEALLKKAKPRVVTLEQTAGLLQRHLPYFNAVINMFTSNGFSVRWRLFNCADFGTPQRRLRLFVIASW